MADNASRRTPPGQPADEKITPSLSFDAERDGAADLDIFDAEATFRQEIQASGHDRSYDQPGGAVLASTQSPEARQRQVERRIFLKGVGYGIAGSFLGGGILWHFLEGESWVPTISDFLDPDPPRSPVVDQEAWRLLQAQADAARSRRDLVALDELVALAPEPFVKQVLRAISHNIRGHIGEAFLVITSFEDHGLLANLPESVRFDVLRHAARIYSTAGDSAKSVTIYLELKRTQAYQTLNDLQRVQMWIDELNHCIQTAQERTSYYDASGPVLRHFDSILSQCLKCVGMDLDTARRFHPVVGPAVICIKEYRNWIATRRVDPSSASRALDRQRQAIDVICERDRYLGPIRFSPLAGQYIRARQWKEAADILVQQRQLWASFDSQPEVNNTLEFAIHRILQGMVNAFGFSNYDGARAEWMEARAILARTRTNRFQAVIADLLLEIAVPAGVPRRKREALELNRRLIGRPFGLDYYFFGRG